MSRTHRVTLSVEVDMTEMDGVPEESAEIALNLVEEQVHGWFANARVEVTDYRDLTPDKHIFTEAEFQEHWHSFEGDAVSQGKFRILVEDWEDVTETPTQRITRLAGEVADMVALLRVQARDHAAERETLISKGRELSRLATESIALLQEAQAALIQSTGKTGG
jgi:hypothetical protein